jgi:hypothetical protein
MAVLNTVAMVMNAFKNAMQCKLPEASFVYDPNLDFPNAKEISRVDDNYKGNLSPTTNPLLLYNRSVLSRSDTLGLRGPRRVFSPINPSSYDVDTYKISHSSFDFKYAYISDKMSVIEEFEILHSTRQGIHGVFNFQLDLSAAQLGIWSYYVDWNDALDEMTTQINGTTYKSVSGSGSVRGFFITLTGTTPVIKNIYLTIYGQDTSIIIDSLTITGS